MQAKAKMTKCAQESRVVEVAAVHAFIVSFQVSDVGLVEDEAVALRFAHGIDVVDCARGVGVQRKVASKRVSAIMVHTT